VHECVSVTEMLQGSKIVTIPGSARVTLLRPKSYKLFATLIDAQGFINQNYTFVAF